LSPEFGNRLKFNLSQSAGSPSSRSPRAEASAWTSNRSRRTSITTISRGIFLSATEIARVIALPNHVFAELFWGAGRKRRPSSKPAAWALAIPLNSFSVPRPRVPGRAARFFRRVEKQRPGRSDGRSSRFDPLPGSRRRWPSKETGWSLLQRQWGIEAV
jgi:hypothetical protein